MAETKPSQPKQKIRIRQKRFRPNLSVPVKLLFLRRTVRPSVFIPMTENSLPILQANNSAEKYWIALTLSEHIILSRSEILTPALFLKAIGLFTKKR